MSEREQFEAWAMQFNPQLLINFGRGPTVRGQIAWEAWQAARAQPAQAGQVLTDAFIRAEALEAFDCYWDADDETLVNKYGHGVYLSRFIDFARAIEQAVLAKRVPQWLPIETAPKDFVSEFDGWNGERVPNVSWAHPEYSPKGHFDWCVSEYETGHGWVNVAVKNLTHWMPLPPPPGIVGEKEGA